MAVHLEAACNLEGEMARLEELTPDAAARGKPSCWKDARSADEHL